MGKKRHLNGKVLLSLLLGIGAALFFLWPFPSHNAEDGPAAGITAPAIPALPGEEAGQNPEPGQSQQADQPRTPGQNAAEAQTQNQTETPAPYDENAGKIRFSELTIKNRATLPDEDGDFPDWIELENVSGDTVELSGWTLRDSEGKDGWSFPETRLGPGQRLVLFASGKDKPGHVSFSLSAGETLQLFTANGAPVQELVCPDGEADRAWLPDGQGGWTESLYPTPGLPNTAESYVSLMEQRQLAGPLAIYEVCTFNRPARWKGLLGTCDWVELKNVSGENVELSDYYLSDSAKERMLYRLPEKTLRPGEYFLLRCSEEENPLGTAELCSAFSLSSSTEQLYLSRADGSLADYASLRGIPYKASYGRMPGQNGWFFLPEPSPGGENYNGQRRVSAMPRSLERDGVYNEVDSVSVSLEGSGTIRYTLDGTTPTAHSPLYEGPITLRETGIVKAVCFEEGALPSRALTLSYIVNENHVLPVVSLVSNDQSLRNVYYSRDKNIEVPCDLSFYDGGNSFSIPCGTRLHGESSLVLPKKNMSVRFRGAYGQDELHYDIFGDGGVCDFNNLLLRAGQDYYHAIVRNEWCTELARSVSDRLIVSRTRYVILYMDGRYMGIYALGEKLNEAMYAHQIGVSRDSVTLEDPPLDGKHAMYREVISYALTHDLSQPEYYEEICARLDVDGLIDWLILEGCFANDDLTFGNIRYVRSLEGDGKWHIVFFDLDSTFNHADSCFANLFSPWALDTRQIGQLTNALLRSPQFRTSLLARASELIPKLSNERILGEFNLLCDTIDPEVERDYRRNDMRKSEWDWNVNWIRDFITKNDWNHICVQNFCYYLHVTSEERALYFPDA